MLKKELSTELLLSKKFETHLKGYDPKEVDEFLDFVINDYNYFEAEIKSIKDKILLRDDLIADLKKELWEIKTDLKAAIEENKALNKKMNSQEVINARLARLESREIDEG
ncbi:MAG: DivIVA domain-containing protein [Mycoplasma sp.]|nr:DivIVA domain-containing protein [Mycoplasma sp.]